MAAQRLHCVNLNHGKIPKFSTDSYGMGQPPPWASRRSQGFSETYRCFPVSLLPGNERENVAYGGKSKLFPFVVSQMLIYLMSKFSYSTTLGAVTTRFVVVDYDNPPLI